MGRNYRAKETSYGFRGMYWAKGDIAEDVLPQEGIHDLFEPIGPGEVIPPVKAEEELNTLSELGEHQNLPPAKRVAGRRKR